MHERASIGRRHVNLRSAYLRRIGEAVMCTRFSWLLSRAGGPRARTVIDGVRRGHPAASLERVNPVRSRPRINAPSRTNGFLITTPGPISHRCLSAVPPPPGRRLSFRFTTAGCGDSPPSAPPRPKEAPWTPQPGRGPRSAVVAAVHGRPGPSAASKRRGPGLSFAPPCSSGTCSPTAGGSLLDHGPATGAHARRTAARGIEPSSWDGTRGGPRRHCSRSRASANRQGRMGLRPQLN